MGPQLVKARELAPVTARASSPELISPALGGGEYQGGDFVANVRELAAITHRPFPRRIPIEIEIVVASPRCVTVHCGAAIE